MTPMLDPLDGRIFVGYDKNIADKLKLLSRVDFSNQ